MILYMGALFGFVGAFPAAASACVRTALTAATATRFSFLFLYDQEDDDPYHEHHAPYDQSDINRLHFYTSSRDLRFFSASFLSIYLL